MRALGNSDTMMSCRVLMALSFKSSALFAGQINLNGLLQLVKRCKNGLAQGNFEYFLPDGRYQATRSDEGSRI